MIPADACLRLRQRLSNMKRFVLLEIQPTLPTTIAVNDGQYDEYLIEANLFYGATTTGDIVTFPYTAYVSISPTMAPTIIETLLVPQTAL